MAKLILLGVVIMTFALPMYMVGRPRPQATLRTIVVIMVFAIFVWAQLCLRTYPQYVQVE